MRLIALTGLPRSGKDTFAERLISRYGYSRWQFSTPLKEAAAILLDRPLAQMYGDDGFDREAVMPEWGFSVRHFLQVLGTECLRNQVRQDFWVKRLRNSIEGLGRVVITDCRFENEADMVRSLGGIVVEIRRPGVTSNGHASNAGVEADYIVMNDGTISNLFYEADAIALAANAEVTRTT